MEFSECFPVWDQLDPRQRELVLTGLVSRRVKKGTPLHGGGDCTGLLCPGHLPVLRLLRPALPPV